MSSRSSQLREIFFFAGAIGIFVLALLVGVLFFSNAFSLLWLARAIFASALLFVVLECILVARVTRVSHALTPHATWRRNDQAPSCSLALLFGVVTLGLLLCGILMEWLVEGR